MKHYFGITVTEIWENGLERGAIFRRHKEIEILRYLAPEERFDIDLILQAILEGGKHGAIDKNR